MPKSKPPRRKLPITSSRATASLPLPKSSQATQSLIQAYHTLLKRKTSLETRLSSSQGSSSDGAALELELREVEGEMEALGGLEAYQAASTKGQGKERGGDSSRVLKEWLKELGEAWRGDESVSSDGKPGKRKLRMLEIGALSPHNATASLPFIHNTPIDLHSLHPEILSQDFLARPLPENDAERFDIVSCSLVLNFVPEAKDRGKMLNLIHAQLHPSPTSYLFLVLPLPCTHNSRYLTPSHLLALMRHVGFEMVRERAREGGKVAYWLFRWVEKGEAEGVGEFGRKKVISEGPKRNNFVILL